MIRVLVVDDHDIVREGVTRMLSDAAGIEVVGEAASGEAALELLTTVTCDVAVLDISMPGMGGLELLTELRRSHPGIAALMLSMHSERDYGLRSIAEGAAGYLTKGHRPDELVDAVRTVATGRRYVTPEMAELLANRMAAGEVAEPHETLSQREFEVFRRLAAGYSVTEISQELYISVKTVSTYRARVLAKLGVERNAELTAYALERGLVQLGHHLAATQDPPAHHAQAQATSAEPDDSQQ